MGGMETTFICSGLETKSAFCQEMLWKLLRQIERVSLIISDGKGETAMYLSAMNIDQRYIVA
jgi:hypothetical protein